jgi:hypothetical protein
MQTNYEVTNRRKWAVWVARQRTAVVADGGCVAARSHGSAAHSRTTTNSQPLHASAIEMRRSMLLILP